MKKSNAHKTKKQQTKKQEKKKQEKNQPHVYAMEAIVLRVLSRKPTYGLQIVQLSNQQISPDTVYVTLRRMERKKYVVSSAAKSRRRVYRLTPLGRQLVKRASRILLGRKVRRRK